VFGFHTIRIPYSGGEYLKLFIPFTKVKTFHYKANSHYTNALSYWKRSGCLGLFSGKRII